LHNPIAFQILSCAAQVLRAGEAAAAELARQQHEQQQLTAGGGVGQELAVSGK
jgi:hypothetical protein